LRPTLGGNVEVNTKEIYPAALPLPLKGGPAERLRRNGGRSPGNDFVVARLGAYETGPTPARSLGEVLVTGT